MKRLLLSLALVLAAPCLFALDTSAPHGRIGVLLMRDRFNSANEKRASGDVRRFLVEELRKLGYEAFDARLTYDELRRGYAGNASAYVEVVSSSAADHQLAGVDVGDRHVSVELSVVLANVAAQIRIYDGQSLELIDTYDLHERKASVLPTGVGFGGWSVNGFIVLPVIQWAQYRSAAHQVAREGASMIAGAGHREQGTPE